MADGLKYKVTADTSQATRAMGSFGKSAEKADLQMKDLDGTMRVGISSLGNLTSSMYLGVGALGALGFGVATLGREFLTTAGTFEKFEVILTKTLGGKSEAQQTLTRLENFAANTPYQLTQLTESFVKLANRGFVPTIAQMTKLGDLASVTGKSFDQLAEAILDAQTFEFERLKEFGIKARQEQNSIKFTFKGVTTEVAKTSQAVQDYVLSLGDLEAVSGSMADISETLEGKVSNLGDSWDRFARVIGETYLPEAKKATSATASLLGWVTKLFEGDGSGKGLTHRIKELEELKQRLKGSSGNFIDEFFGVTPESRLKEINAELKNLREQLAKLTSPTPTPSTKEPFSMLLKKEKFIPNSNDLPSKLLPFKEDRGGKDFRTDISDIEDIEAQIQAEKDAQYIYEAEQYSAFLDTKIQLGNEARESEKESERELADFKIQIAQGTATALLAIGQITGKYQTEFALASIAINQGVALMGAIASVMDPKIGVWAKAGAYATMVGIVLQGVAQATALVQGAKINANGISAGGFGSTVSFSNSTNTTDRFAQEARQNKILSTLESIERRISNIDNDFAVGRVNFAQI